MPLKNLNLQISTICLSLALLLLTSCKSNSISIGEKGTLKSRTLPNVSSSQETAQLNPCSQKIQGPPLGIACLHCAHPKAQAQAIQIAEILRDSCRENIAMTMLVDDTFGTDRNFLGELVRISSEYGARLHLYLYLGNGPWQRRSSGLPQRGFGTGISPENFRKRIISDEALRNEYRQLIKFNEPLISYATSLGNIAYVIPMLEDNLHSSAAKEMRNLITSTILPSLIYALGRNPCPGCYPGNDTSLSSGIFMDQHVISDINPSYRDGLATNDGTDMSFTDYSTTGNELSLSQLKTIIAQSKATNNTFVIWNGEYQGVSANSGLIDPDSRVYKEVSTDERRVLMEILRTP